MTRRERTRRVCARVCRVTINASKRCVRQISVSKELNIIINEAVIYETSIARRILCDLPSVPRAAT